MNIIIQQFFKVSWDIIKEIEFFVCSIPSNGCEFTYIREGDTTFQKNALESQAITPCCPQTKQNVSKIFTSR